MLVTDGSCLINDNGGGYSSPAAGGSMRSCSTPAHPSVAGTLVVCASASCAPQALAGPQKPYGTTSGVTNYVSQVNPLLSTANCANPGPQYLTSAGLATKTVCYPQNHQVNVKLFDLKTNTWVATFPTGGGCIDNGYPNPPLGDAHILGRLGTVVRQSDSGGHFRVPFTVSRMILDVTLWSSRGVAMSLQKLTDLGLSLGRFGDRRLDKRGRRCSDAWSCVRACACGDWRAGGGRRRSASGDFWPTPR